MEGHDEKLLPTEPEDAKDVVLASDLPEPEKVAGVADLPRYPPRTEPTSRGYIGGLIRTVKNIPSCVWVMNQHSEEITVVVSKYRPNRILTGGGLSASPTGAGLDFSAATFQSPASRKVLAPRAKGLEYSTAMFPLWTRQEGFGVITVFSGPERSLFIENDRIPLGAMAYFTGKPDLRIIRHYQPPVCKDEENQEMYAEG